MRFSRASLKSGRPSREPAPDLTDLICEARTLSSKDHMCVVLLRLADKSFPAKYSDTSMNDFAVFITLMERIEAGEFKNGSIWSAWHYGDHQIHPRIRRT